MTPWLDDGDLRLYHGDCLEVLRGLPDRSVHMCATSPPFYGLRDYGTGRWEGGDPDCDHEAGRKNHGHAGDVGPRNESGNAFRNSSRYVNQGDPTPSSCGKCGARRVDRQIGLEESPDLWVERLVEVFREVRRVLRDDGVCFIEIGDSYVSSAHRGARESGTPYTEPEGSTEPDSSCLDLCGECGGDRSIRSPRTPRLPDESDELAGETDPDMGRRPSSSRSSEPRVARASTTLNDAGARPLESNESDGDSQSVHPTPPATSADDAPSSSHTSACTCGTARQSPTSGRRSSGTESSALACARSIPTASLLPAKSLLGQPWRLAFALQNDGWILRSEIVWMRPNPMPESVSDRPTKAHSTIFLLSKQPRYFWDADAIREDYAGRVEVRQGRVGAYQNRAMNGLGDGTSPTRVLARPAPQSETLGDLPPEAPRGPDGRRQTGVKGGENSEQHRDGERWPNPAGANARSVWSVPTEPTPFAHFATWPQKLVARMVKAGTSEKGCCPECGAPWERVTEIEHERLGGSKGREPTSKPGDHNWSDVSQRTRKVVSTLGWQPSCSHDHPPVPCTVLDIFAGSGTTLKVARDHGRHSVGIELNEQYLKIAADRLAQQSLLTGEAA